MKSRYLVPVIAAAWAALPLGSVMAQTAPLGSVQAQARDPLQDRDRSHGSELMSEQERNDDRHRMREITTGQEREQFRSEHHMRMQERAKERGLKLADEPPVNGRSAGAQAGAGVGARPMPAGGGGGGKGR